jgi:hypothetical protein
LNWNGILRVVGFAALLNQVVKLPRHMANVRWVLAFTICWLGMNIRLGII